MHPFGPEAHYHLLTTLTRISERSDSAAGWLSQVFDRRIDLLTKVALRVAMETEGLIGQELAKRLEKHGDRKLYGTLARLCEDRDVRRSVALRDVALTATSRFLDTLLQEVSSTNEATAVEIAKVAINLGVRLSDAGRYDEALKVLLDTLAAQRRMATIEPEELLPDMATALNNLGDCLSAAGRLADAVLVMELALESFTTLEQDNPGRFLHDVAMCLNNLSGVLGEAGRSQEGLAAACQAVESYRQLAEQRPLDFLPDLAGGLNNLALRLKELGKHGEALAAGRESEEIFCRLALESPDSFLPDHARSVLNLAPLLEKAGFEQEALDTAETAVSLYRQLRSRHRGAFESPLAASLINASQLLGNHDRWEEAVRYSQEAVTLLRQASGGGGWAKSSLAEALDTLSRNLSWNGSPHEALLPIEEAIAIRRELAALHPESGEPVLAGSLGNYAHRLESLGLHEQALPMISEAVRLLPPHVARNPRRFLGWMDRMMRQYLSTCMALDAEPDPDLLQGVSELLDRLDETVPGDGASPSGILLPISTPTDQP